MADDGVEVDIRDDGIAELVLQRHPVNAMDTALCRGVAERCRDLGDRPEVRAVVLRSAAKAFCAGVDLTTMLERGADYTRGFLDALTACFAAVYDLEVPTVAAVNGSAVAGGAILAAACDRVIATSEGARIGLTELRVGVPFPTTAIEIVRNRTAPTRFAEIVLHGRLYRSEEARTLGLVDEVVAGDQVEPRAREVAAELAAVPAATYRLTKAQLQRPAREAIAAHRTAWDRQADAGWTSEEVRDVVAAFVERTLRR